VGSRFAGLLVPVAAIALWQLLVATGVLDYEYLPSPLGVGHALADLAASGDLAADLAHTLGVAVLAALIAVILGGATGLAVGLAPAVGAYLMTSVDFLRTIPAVALLPVVVLSFGTGVETELILAVYAAQWPVLLNTAAGIAAVHPRQYDVARTLQLSRPTTVRAMVVPALMPEWLVGARIAAVIALLVAIVAEMIITPRGLGGGLVESMNALAPARMWAYALVCATVGYLLNATLRHIVRVAIPGSAADPAHEMTAADRVRRSMPWRGLLLPTVVLAMWQISARSDSLSFPPPDEWFKTIARMHTEGVLAPAVLRTLTTFAVGLVLATIIGAAVGIAIGASRRLDRALTPTIDFVAAMPGAAVVPVAVLLLGTSLLSGVAVVTLVVSWPVLLNAASAMRTFPSIRLEMSRTLGLSTSQRWRKVILPTLAPGIMLGVRVAASLALIIALLAEILGTGAGIGRLLLVSQQMFDAPAAWGLLAIVGIFGYLTSAALARVEVRVAIPAPA